MKGKQASPAPQGRSPRKGTAAAAAAAAAVQEKPSPSTSSTAKSPQKVVKDVNSDGASKKPQNKRKLVYKYGPAQQTSSISATPSASVVGATSAAVMEAAQAVLKRNFAKSGNAKVTKTKPKPKSAKSPPVEVEVTAPTATSPEMSTRIEEIGDTITVTGTILELETEPIGVITVGKKVIKSVPGQIYIQEVRTELGDFLNFRCKLCKVRFTDLKEIHMRGRRHRLNLANAQKKTNSADSPIPPVTATVQTNSKPVPGLIPVVPVKKKPRPIQRTTDGKPIKKRAPATFRKPPAILDNLIRSSSIADMLMQEKKKENFTIYTLYKEMRESCVLSDRWCVPEPIWDPCTNREVLLCYETDVLMDGSVRMKRCLKVLDDFELIVLLDGVDKTHIFKEKHPTIKSTQEMLDLIRKVTMIKVCSGIKDCDPTEFDTIASKVVEKGGSWYSTECNVEVERGCLGNICKRCTSLRNTIRRKMRRQYGIEANQNNPAVNRSLLSNTMKPVLRTVGEALYLNLQHMSRINRTSVSSEDDLPPPPPRSSEQVLHPELGIYMSSELKERLDEVAANPPPPITKIEHIVEFDPRTNTKTLKQIHTPIPPSSLPRGSFSSIGGLGGVRSVGLGGSSKRLKADITQNQRFTLGNNGELTLVQTPNGETIQLPEGYVLADDSQQWGDGNIVIQKLADSQQDNEQFILGDDNSLIQVGNLGNNFTLEDGEEYEVIGEAPSGVDGDIQVLPLSTNSDIEIIEVDENMIQLVDENSQPEIQPVDSNSDIFKFLQAHSRLSGH